LIKILTAIVVIDPRNAFPEQIDEFGSSMEAAGWRTLVRRAAWAKEEVEGHSEAAVRRQHLTDVEAAWHLAGPPSCKAHIVVADAEIRTERFDVDPPRWVP